MATNQALTTQIITIQFCSAAQFEIRLESLHQGQSNDGLLLAFCLPLSWLHICVQLYAKKKKKKKGHHQRSNLVWYPAYGENLGDWHQSHQGWYD